MIAKLNKIKRFLWKKRKGSKKSLKLNRLDLQCIVFTSMIKITREKDKFVFKFVSCLMERDAAVLTLILVERSVLSQGLEMTMFPQKTSLCLKSVYQFLV